MFEGQRLSYIVPGYSGYFIYNAGISQRKFMMLQNHFRRKKELHIFQDMQDM
jgi:hypothetical protein